MSNYCASCGEFKVAGFGHVCPPRWHVHLLDYDEPGEAKEVYARNAQEAAEKRAEQYDARAGDYPLARNLNVDAVVWDSHRQNPTRFSIDIASMPVYTASKSRDAIPDDVLQLDDAK